MKILNRYLFVQVASAVLMSLGLFIFVLVTGNVLRQVIGELANGRLSMPTLFELIGLISVSVIPYAMPLGMLTGVLPMAIDCSESGVMHIHAAAS